jgi:hypothetical protein
MVLKSTCQKPTDNSLTDDLIKMPGDRLPFRLLTTSGDKTVNVPEEAPCDLYICW